MSLKYFFGLFCFLFFIYKLNLIHFLQISHNGLVKFEYFFNINLSRRKEEPDGLVQVRVRLEYSLGIWLVGFTAKGARRGWEFVNQSPQENEKE